MARAKAGGPSRPPGGTRPSPARRLLQKDLQTARDLQMGLLPGAPPRLEGHSSAGRCLPAAQVGGGSFQYYQRPGHLSVALADVAGHGMEAAIPAVMFSGILDSHMHMGQDLAALLGRLNEILCERLTGHTHVTMALVELELATGVLRFTNAGCPYPCHYVKRTAEVTEIPMDAYPLGLRRDTRYSATEVQLQAGDYVLLYSDGIAEAANVEGDLFGFDRTLDATRAACDRGLPPDEVIDHVLAAVRVFTGDAPQGDDMTCVVVKVEA